MNELIRRKEGRRKSGCPSPLPLLEGLEPRTLLSATPNDPNFSSQWYLQNTTTPGNDIDVAPAWNVTTGSNNVVIAVLDSGVNMTDPDLINNIWTNPGIVTPGFTNDIHGWNFLTNSNNVSDTYGHGTAVATIIGAQGNNGIGSTGVDWHISILPVVVGDSTGVTDQNLIAGINYVIALKQEGVNIVAINASYLSFGFPGTAALSAVQNAGNNGILYVAAAGNSSMNLDSIIPSGFLPSNMIMVAATDNQNNLASFSNFGSHSVAVGAPGDNVLTNWDGFYVPLSGTSFAAPMVSGIIGLLKAADPNATMTQLENAILNTGIADASLAGKTITGKRVDAGAAMQYILATIPTVTDHLAFIGQPTNAMAGSNISPAITVAVEDVNGNVVTADTSNVTLSIASGPSGATLGGTVTVAAVNGVATFSAVTLSTNGTFTLAATDGNDTAATSASFIVYTPAQQKYVVQLYQDILHRAADAGGLAHWTAQLGSGAVTDQAVALGLSASREYYGDVINAFYVQYLGRNADPAGLNAWVNLMAAGTGAEAIRVDIVSSQEYYNDGGGTAAGYVTELYQALLGRAPDPSGLAYWEGILAGKGGAAAVAGGLIYSSEFYGDIISGYYQTYLHRAADAGGLAMWVGQLKAGVSEAVIISDFVSSAEYMAVNNIS